MPRIDNHVGQLFLTLLLACDACNVKVLELIVVRLVGMEALVFAVRYNVAVGA